MGTWGAGNLDSDYALDELSQRAQDLIVEMLLRWQRSHEVVEYTPSLAEWKITAGIWAFGALILTAGLKAGLAVWTGLVRR